MAEIIKTEEVDQEEIERLVKLYKSLDREARVVWMSGGNLLRASSVAREARGTTENEGR